MKKVRPVLILAAVLGVLVCTISFLHWHHGERSIAKGQNRMHLSRRDADGQIAAVLSPQQGQEMKLVSNEVTRTKIDSNHCPEVTIHEMGEFTPNQSTNPIRLVHTSFPVTVPSGNSPATTNLARYLTWCSHHGTNQMRPEGTNRWVCLVKVGDGYYQEGTIDQNGEFTPNRGTKPIRIAHDSFPISTPPIYGMKLGTTLNLTDYLNELAGTNDKPQEANRPEEAGK